MSDVAHAIGLILGPADDWARGYEALLRRLGVVTSADGSRHRVQASRVSLSAFGLRDAPRHALVIDRRPQDSLPWLTKMALVDGVHLLNSPSASRHAVACALVRLGFKVPGTVLVPESGAVSAAAQVGFPLFLSPYAGGGSLAVRDADALAAVCDPQGERLLQLQAAVTDYDVCARTLSIGPSTMVMKYRPSQPLHSRYEVDHNFLSAETGSEVVTVARVIGALFGWEFHSCDALVRGNAVFPIDYADTNPDVAVTSLHYYFPWAMAELLRWTVFCVVSGRASFRTSGLSPAASSVRGADGLASSGLASPGRCAPEISAYFAIADDASVSYAEKLGEYRRLADEYFETQRYEEFCARHLSEVDEIVHDWVSSEEFRSLLRENVRALYPVHEHDKFLGHFGGLIDAWVRDHS